MPACFLPPIAPSLPLVTPCTTTSLVVQYNRSGVTASFAEVLTLLTCQRGFLPLGTPYQGLPPNPPSKQGFDTAVDHLGGLA